MITNGLKSLWTSVLTQPDGEYQIVNMTVTGTLCCLVERQRVRGPQELATVLTQWTRLSMSKMPHIVQQEVLLSVGVLLHLFPGDTVPIRSIGSLHLKKNCRTSLNA